MTVRKTALLLFVAATVPAFAQQPSDLDKEMAALREYCKADIDRLCPKVEPGSGRIKECLMHNLMHNQKKFGGWLCSGTAKIEEIARYPGVEVGWA